MSNVILVGHGTSGGQAGPKFAGVKIALHCHLRPLAPDEVRAYLAHHLRLAGSHRPDLLAPDVVAGIAEISGCLPGKINKIARAALWAVPAESGAEITPEVIAEVGHLLDTKGTADEEDGDGVQAAAPRESLPDRDIRLSEQATPAVPAAEGSLPEGDAALAPPPAEEGERSAAERGPVQKRPQVEAEKQAWPLELTESDRSGDHEQETADSSSEGDNAGRSLAGRASAGRSSQERRPRARRFWMGLGTAGLAAALLLAAALHETWPKKIVGLLEEYGVMPAAVLQVAESITSAREPQASSAASETETPVATPPNMADGVVAEQSAGLPKPPIRLTADVGREDEPLRLQVQGSLEGGKDMPGIEVTVAGLPAGARLSAGTRDKAGLWHLQTEDLLNLTLLPPTDYSGNFGLAVSVASRQADGEIAYATQAVPIHIKAVPDVPLLQIKAAAGEEGEPLPLDIDAELVDADGSEILTIFLSNLPEGARLSAGKRQSDGSWQLEPEQAKGLRLVPPKGLSGSFTVTVMALASERDGGSVPAKLPLPVTIEPGPAAPLLTLAPIAGLEDEPLPLALAASLAEGSAAESLYLLISGMPEGARLSAGHDIGAGVWRVEQGALPDLTILPPKGWNGGFDLAVTAVAVESDGSEVSVSEKAPVRFDASQAVAGVPLQTVPSQAENALQATAKLSPSDGAREDLAGGDFDIAKGDSLLAAKDLTAARQYFQQAAELGIPKAMTAMGVTYDPVELARLGIAENEGDRSLARHWYLRGVAAGDLEAMKRLQSLSAQP